MDVRRERAVADREVRRREGVFYNLNVDWYEFDRHASTQDDVYDDGPERAYGPPKPVRLLWVVVLDEGGVPTEEGRIIQRQIQGAVSIAALESAGVTVPDDATDILDSVISFNGELFKIDTYEPTGHFGKARGFTVGFTATRRRPGFDMPMDSWPYVGEL